VFSGEPVFPSSPWSQPQWLPLLRDVGLRSDVDASTFPACAKHVALRWRRTQQQQRCASSVEAVSVSAASVETPSDPTAEATAEAEEEEEEEAVREERQQQRVEGSSGAETEDAVYTVAMELVRHMLEHLSELVRTPTCFAGQRVC
jgi:hypothetical protein